MSGDVESRLYRAESWLKRARDSSGHLDGQFIFHWIALNALYGQRGSEAGPPRDRDDLNVFLSRIAACGQATLRDALTSLNPDAALLLESEFLYEDYWITGYTDSLAMKIDRATRTLESWPGRGLARNLIALFGRLAILRNQIIHGSSKDGSGANRASVEPAVRILTRLVPIFCFALRSHPDRDWGLLPFPAKGRHGHPEDLRRTR